MIGTTPVPLGRVRYVALVYWNQPHFYLNEAFRGRRHRARHVSLKPTLAPPSVMWFQMTVPASTYGGIDELSVYNRALSFNEIAVIYLAGSYGKCEVRLPVLSLGSPRRR